MSVQVNCPLNECPVNVRNPNMKHSAACDRRFFSKEELHEHAAPSGWTTVQKDLHLAKLVHWENFYPFIRKQKLASFVNVTVYNCSFFTLFKNVMLTVLYHCYCLFVCRNCMLCAALLARSFLKKRFFSWQQKIIETDTTICFKRYLLVSYGLRLCIKQKSVIKPI